MSSSRLADRAYRERRAALGDELAAGRSCAPRCSASGRTSSAPARWLASWRRASGAWRPRFAASSSPARRRRPSRCARRPSPTSWRWPSSTPMRPRAAPRPTWIDDPYGARALAVDGRLWGASSDLGRAARHRPRGLGGRGRRRDPGPRRAAQGLGAGGQHRRQRGRHQRDPGRVRPHRRPDRRRGRHHRRHGGREPEAARGDLRRGQRGGLRRPRAGRPRRRCSTPPSTTSAVASPTRSVAWRPPSDLADGCAPPPGPRRPPTCRDARSAARRLARGAAAAREIGLEEVAERGGRGRCAARASGSASPARRTCWRWRAGPASGSRPC